MLLHHPTIQSTDGESYPFTPETLEPEATMGQHFVVLSNDNATLMHFSALLKVVEDSQRIAFDQAVREIDADTMIASSISQITGHEGFQNLIRMGRPAAKLILERMRESDFRLAWFPALKRIFNVDPVPVNERGNVPRMAQAWITWAKGNSII